MKQQFLVVTCIGSDRPGLVNELTKIILDAKANIVDSRMAVLGEDFAILMLVSGSWDTIAKLEGALSAHAKDNALALTTHRTEQKKQLPQAMPYIVDAVSVDTPGLVHHLAGFFSQRNINIEDLNTNHYAAPHTGTPMFAIHITIAIPANTHLSSLREDFFAFCDEMNIDAVLEPLKL